ncbi:transcription elongation factor Spt6 [Meredithblackwellia eburnea MCA 4105]
MSTADLLRASTRDEDEEMDAEGSEDEDGVDLMGDNTGDEDSSEEDEEDDSEEERRVRKDFIVDEDESSSRKKKRRKKHRSDGDEHRKRRKDSHDDAGDLDEDDLALLEENTGQRLGARGSSHKRKRLRRRGSASSGSESEPAGLNNIFDDEDREAADTGGLFDADEMAGFIEDDTASDSSRQGSDSESEDERAARREKKKREKKKKAKGPRRTGFSAAMVEGITAEALEEINEVFGDGKDYAEALDYDPEEREEKELKDIFEPSEIASRMLTEADDLIRQVDIPERMQLASTGIPSLPSIDGSPVPFIAEEDLDDAALWMSHRVSKRCTDQFLSRDHRGGYPPLHTPFLEALKNVIKFINIEFLEVPFIWNYRSDFIFYFIPAAHGSDEQTIVFLNMDDLWRVAALSIKYRAFAHKKQELRKLFNSLDVVDDYFEDVYGAMESVEEVSDTHDWLAMKYSTKIAEVKTAKDLEDNEGTSKMKRATRESRYDNARRSVVSKLADAIGITATELSQDYSTLNKTHFQDDPEKSPEELAEEYASGEYRSAESALKAAKMILVYEIAHDPMLKKEARRFFKDYGHVTVSPTEVGITKIDEMHPFYSFMYLQGKPIDLMYRSTQFLQILSAEQEGLVKSSVYVFQDAHRKFVDDLTKMYTSDYVSKLAESWNNLRTEILEEAIKDHLMPAAELWARNMIVEEEEDFLSSQCAAKLELRINTAPYERPDKTMDRGDAPSVLAISHGNGDPRRDSVVAIFLDSDGHFREHAKFDRLDDPGFGGSPESCEQFKDLLERRRPQVIVVGGFSPNTRRLKDDVQRIAGDVTAAIVERNESFDEDHTLSAEERLERAQFSCIYAYDDVARIYQNSKRAATEFPELSTLGKYCVALARYVQSPLNEYAALGPDLTTISFDPNQKLLSKEKLGRALDRALCDVVAKVGVDINRAIRNQYYFNLLPYVPGLGPRKASAVVNKINGPIGGTLSSRSTLITAQVMTKNIFMNAAAYLRIPQDDLNADLRRNTDDDKADILDDTRIHPEDYEVARKMAADAMEYDEEDIGAFSSPSQAVTDVMEEGPEKLNELSLDDFASELTKILKVPKRLSLYGIRDEMQNPFGEHRRDFMRPSNVEVFSMLTGETKATLDAGLIIPVRVARLRAEDSILCRLDSGIDGIVAEQERAPGPPPKVGALIQALVLNVDADTFMVDLSTLEHNLIHGDKERRKVFPDTYYDMDRAQAELQAQAAIKQRGQGRQKRVIDHPNFHNFNASEAELYLTHQPRGECVIRPSSKEDHLAVTWKVDEGVFQHIAVVEMNKVNEFSVGSPLKIGNKYSYTDLDELIVMHVKQMARKVEEMMMHEKYKGTQELLDNFLRNQTMANPNQSAYGFGLDKTKPGQFVVGFRTNFKAEIQSWPIKVVPGAYSLLGEDHGDVLSLCTAFKTAYTNKSKDGVRMPTGMGGRTPNPYGRTPNPYSGRTPNPQQGGRTPNPQGGRTPNPQGGRGTPLVAGRATPLAGRATPAYSGAFQGGGPRAAYSSTTPLHPGVGGGQATGPPGGQQAWPGR